MWKVLNKEVDLEEPTSFLDHVYLGCTKDNAKQAKTLWTITEPCSNSRLSAGGNRKTVIPSKIIVFLHGLMIWRVMQRSVWNDYCELANKTTQTTLQSNLLHASMTTTSKRKKQNLLENCQLPALKLFSNVDI